ncbi:MAG TPA: metallopeptidase TldD-related protein [Candidatus Acidoferrales bacterium]|nr:metallopeptidase TldD-related protein [Candidatus Acidoferrales bacterium]
MKILRASLISLSGVAFLLWFVVRSRAGAVPPADDNDPQPVSAAFAAADSDPVLKAMQEELERSKAQLKMENVPAPFYIEYRVVDTDDYQLQAEFGATESERRAHFRFARVVVRVGDYHLDSFYESGTGEATAMPLDDDSLALRHALWLATDSAYKSANEALTAKQGLYKRYAIEQTVDDFAKEPPVQSLRPLARLEFDPAKWRSVLESATGLYREYPDVQSVGANVRFLATNVYFINTEGTVLRGGKACYSVSENGSTQATDGMRIDRSPGESYAEPSELPTREQVLGDMRQMLQSLVDMRTAPIVEEEYRGPVLFSADASNDVVETLLAANVVGRRPQPNVSARTVGAFASSFKSRVLPEFLSLVDNPTQTMFGGRSLIGSYPVDDEGVKAEPVSVVSKGMLDNFLLGRRPIRGFTESNGHGRLAQGGQTEVSIGVLMLQPAQPLTHDEIQQKLLELCRQQDRPYCYSVETLGPRLSPRLLYRVWTKDGRRELVRGGEFQELDTRSLRSDVIAAANDYLVSNRLGQTSRTLISPSILFDELVVKRADLAKEKLPEYPAPPLANERAERQTPSSQK